MHKVKIYMATFSQGCSGSQRLDQQIRELSQFQIAALRDRCLTSPKAMMPLYFVVQQYFCIFCCATVLGRRS